MTLAAMVRHPVDLDQQVEELAARFASTAAGHDRTAGFPYDNLRALGEAGLTGLTVPRHLGGGGVGVAAANRVIGRIAAGEASTALIFAMTLIQQAGIARNPRVPDRLRALVGRSGVAGGYLNALRVEPELGSPMRGGLPATTATRTASGWRISGHKRYSTGIHGLSWALVWGRTDEPEPRVGQFLVPVPSPGLRIEPAWDHMGMRATGSDDVILDGVEIAADHAVDLRPPAEWRPDPVGWAWLTLPVAALYDGIARAAVRWLVGYLRERTPSGLGAPLSTVPRIQSEIGEIEGLLMTNRRLLTSASAEVDRGEPPAVDELGLIKRQVTGNAIRAVEQAVALIGNPALDRKNPLERHLRDVLCSRIHTPQDDSVVLAAGKVALLAS